MKEKDLATLEAFFSLSFFYFSSSVTCAFPWSIKGEAGRPTVGIQTQKIKTQENNTSTWLSGK